MSRTFDFLFENAPLGIILLHPDGIIRDVNPAASRMFPHGGLVGGHLREMFMDAEEAKTLLGMISESDGAADVQAVLKRGDAKGFRAVLHAEKMDADEGVVLFVKDVDAERAAEDELQKAIAGLEEDMRQESREMSALVEKLARKNRDFERLKDMSMALQLCRSREELFGVIAKHAMKFFPGMCGELLLKEQGCELLTPVLRFGRAVQDSLEVPAKACPMAGAGSGCFLGEEPLLSACDNQECPHAKGRCLPVTAFGERLGVLALQPRTEADDADENYRSIAQTAAALADHIALDLANFKLRETLLAQSTKDPLTGVFNRRSMMESLEVEAGRCRRRSRSLGLLMFDIDHFKAFNDTYGHKAGDLVLQSIGEHLQSNFRPEDIPCRYGGEEFLLILPEIDRDGLIARAEELRQGIKGLALLHDGRDLGTVTVSIGGAVYPEDTSNVQELISLADRRLYQVKHNGRDGVCIGDELITSPFEGAAQGKIIRANA